MRLDSTKHLSKHNIFKSFWWEMKLNFCTVSGFVVNCISKECLLDSSDHGEEILGHKGEVD